MCSGMFSWCFIASQRRVTIDHDLCILCMDCAEVCPIKAIVYIE
ncbi:4Fe-4S binding protein [Methanococcoides alaskense]